MAAAVLGTSHQAGLTVPFLLDPPFLPFGLIPIAADDDAAALNANRSRLTNYGVLGSLRRYSDHFVKITPDYGFPLLVQPFERGMEFCSVPVALSSCYQASMILQYSPCALAAIIGDSPGLALQEACCRDKTCGDQRKERRRNTAFYGCKARRTGYTCQHGSRKSQHDVGGVPDPRPPERPTGIPVRFTRNTRDLLAQVPNLHIIRRIRIGDEVRIEGGTAIGTTHILMMSSFQLHVEGSLGTPAVIKSSQVKPAR